LLEFLVAGGDRRSCLLADELKKQGYAVQTLGVNPGDDAPTDAPKADVLLLPYPFSVKDGRIRNQAGLELSMEDVLCRGMDGAAIFYHGRLENPRADFRWVPYDSDPDFLRENARISAEGAVSALMLATEDSLRNMHCLVTGYGVFGRELARMLMLFGSKVTVAARRQEALDLARLDGASVVALHSLGDASHGFDAVLNTVPAQIISADVLERLPAHCLLMELASQPGGFDQQKAKELHLPVLNLPGIPGKYAPRAAAKALMKTVISACKELEK